MLDQIAAGASSSYSLDKLNQVMGAVETVRDMASWAGKRPDPLPEFSYAETRAFDMQLHVSLAAALPTVNVKVDGRFARNAVPERMGQWLEQLKKSGGSVRSCMEETRTRSFFVLLGLAYSLAKQTDKWVMYRPVAAYDAVLILSPQSAVKNAVFVGRGSVSACPAGTHEVQS